MPQRPEAQVIQPPKTTGAPAWVTFPRLFPFTVPVPVIGRPCPPSHQKASVHMKPVTGMAPAGRLMDMGGGVQGQVQSQETVAIR